MSEDKKGHSSHGKKVGTIKLTSQHGGHSKPIALQYSTGSSKSSKEKTKDNFPENNAGYIEEQFILRVPDQLAQSMRQYISEQQKPYPGIPAEDIGITFQDDGRNLVFQFREEYIGTLVDLPCIIETQKTVDNINYYKSADIGQMIVIHDEQQESDYKSMSYDSDFKFHHGITPPAKNIRRRRFRKITERQKQELGDVEDEMLKLMKGGSLGEEIEIVDASQLHNYDASPAQTPQTRNLEDEFAKELEDELNFDDEETMEAVAPVQAPKKTKKPKEKKERKEKKEKRKGKGKGKTIEENPSTPSTPAPTTPRTPGSLKITLPISRPKAVPQTSPAQSPMVSPQTSPAPTVFSPPQGPSSPVTTPPSFASAFMQTGPLSPQVNSTVSPTPMEYSTSIEQFFNPMDTTGPIMLPKESPPVFDFRNDPAYISLKNEEATLVGEIQQLQATIAEFTRNSKNPNRVIADRYEKRIQELNPTFSMKQERLSIVQREIQMKESGM